MEIKFFEDIDKAEWDNLVKVSDNTWFFDQYEYINLSSNLLKLKNLSIGFYNGKKLLGIFPLFLSGDVLYTNQTHPVFTGISEKKIYRLVLEYIDNLRMQYNIKKVSFTLPSLSNNFLNNIKIPYFIELGATNSLSSYHSSLVMQIPVITHIIDLTKTINDIFSQFDTRCKTAINKAKKMDFEIVEENNINSIEKFYDILSETFSRTGAGIRDKAYFIELKKLFTDNIKIYFAKYNNEYISTVMVISYNNKALYFAGGTKNYFLSSGIGNLMQFQIMEFLKKDNVQFYEIGNEFPMLKQDGNRNKMYEIGRFKSSFGGNRYLRQEGEIVFDIGKHLLKGLMRFYYVKFGRFVKYKILNRSV